MLKFVLGVIVGGIVGFVVCAIFGVAANKGHTETLLSKDKGEDNVPSK